MKNLICVCLLAAFVMSTVAFPEDEVVPETALTLSLLSTRHPELKHATPKDAAHAKVKMMQAQGFDNTQCNQMATDAITGMTSTLKGEQDAVDALSTGADCLLSTPATRRLLSTTTAQQHLDAAAAALVAATTDLATKEATLQANRAAPITLPLSIFLLTDFAAIMAALAVDPTVVAAKQAVATAQTARDAANILVAAAQATYDTTLVDAQDSSQECLCNAKTAHDLAWPIAQKVVTDNTQAWKEAHHVKCAVDGTADDACSVPVFAATDRPLITEASSADCATSTSSPAQGPLYRTSCSGSFTYCTSANPNTRGQELVNSIGAFCDRSADCHGDRCTCNDCIIRGRDCAIPPGCADGMCGGLFFATQGTNVCPAGSVPLDTEAECVSAANKLGRIFDGKKNWGIMPKGCFNAHQHDFVYFNEHPTGSAFWESSPICSGEPDITAAPTLSSAQERYYRMPQGSADCEFNTERIQTEADCRAALDVLAPLCSASKWTGNHFDIPRCCSERAGHCGNNDWHWNSASTTSCDTQVGNGRSDTAPICQRQ